MSYHPGGNGNGNDDRHLDAMARVAAEAAHGAAATVVAPVYEIASRAARAAEHGAQLAGTAVTEGRTHYRELAKRQRYQEAATKQLSADVADLAAVVLQATARDAAQDQAISEARQRAEDARREAIAAQERAETTGQFPVAEIRARQQSDAAIVHRLQELGLKTAETSTSVVVHERHDVHRARLRIIVAFALTINAALGLLLALALKGYFR
jgi:hypothetical protein